MKRPRLEESKPEQPAGLVAQKDVVKEPGSAANQSPEARDATKDASTSAPAALVQKAGAYTMVRAGTPHVACMEVQLRAQEHAHTRWPGFRCSKLQLQHELQRAHPASCTPVMHVHTQREEYLIKSEADGDIAFKYVENNGSPENMMYLIGLKNIFSKQLPNMPKEYICRLVLDRRHRCAAGSN